VIHRSDPYNFNPAKSSIYSRAYAFILGDFQMPKSSPQNIVMFDKIMGTDKIGRYLEEKFMSQQIEAYYTPELRRFKQERENYLLPQFGPSIGVMVSENPLRGDLCLFIDIKN
jgi:uncharacterized protein YbbC (DUF1343 family)